MLILDTDHFSEFLAGTKAAERLRNRLVGEVAVTTIITIEEQSRGWLSRIKQARDIDEKVAVYERYHHMILSTGSWTILPWDKPAAVAFKRLASMRPKIGTADLMIASIALATGAPVLTRNLRDFGRVPDLDARNWLE